MGLDMYMYRMPRHNGTTTTEIMATESFFKYLEYVKERGGDCTFAEWNGFFSKHLPDRKVREFYKDYFTPEYSEWDKERKHVWHSIAKQIAYWRKVNAVHKWFVDNVQDGKDDCDYYEVSKENVENLLQICREVDANKDLAYELLPTQSGFLFGCTDYDEWYFDDIKETINQLEKILKETNFDKEMLCYHSSW